MDNFMKSQQIVTSIESQSASIGKTAAMHLDSIWRGLMQTEGSTESDLWFRLISGVAHPLGNVAILSEPSDLAVVAEAVGPLYKLATPIAVLFAAVCG